jgi:hypothetical protein
MFSHLYLSFTTKILYAFLISPIRPTSFLIWSP